MFRGVRPVSGITLFWVVVLGVLDAIAVYFIMKYGVQHGEPSPEKPEESQAVEAIRKMNAERLAKIESARARQLPSGEAQSS